MNFGDKLEELNDLIWKEQRDISFDEVFQLAWFVEGRTYIPGLERTFSEMGDPNRMFGDITGTSMGEMKRAGGVKCSPLFNTGFFDVQWGVLSLGKKNKEVFFINPPEFPLYEGNE